MEWIKRKYAYKALLYLLLLLITLVLVFFSIYQGRTVLFLIAFILLGIVFAGLLYYNGACYLMLRKKNDPLIDTRVDRKEYFEKRKEKKEKKIVLFDKIMNYSLYSIPFVIALSILLGVFALDSLFFTLFLPAILIAAMLIFFFFKEIYANMNVEESDVIEKETVYMNNNVICYNGICYIYKGFGFKFKEDKQTFLNVKFSTLKIDEEDIKTKTMELINEVRD